VKLLFPTATFARKAMVQFHYGKPGLFFLGEQPPVPALLAFDLPGLKSQGHEAITKWIIAHHQSTKKSKKTHEEETAVPRDMWRRAVVDDYLDAANAVTYIWHASTYFSLEELVTFAETHGPALDRDARGAMSLLREARPKALAKVIKRAEIVVPLISAAHRRCTTDLEELKNALDREDVAKLKKAKTSVAAWISACAELRSAVVKAELLLDIARRLVAEADEKAIVKALDQMIEKKLHEVYVAELFTILGDKLPLPPNVTGETIDLALAREVTVKASWQTYMAKRVGPVKVGRGALYTYAKNGSAYTVQYVRGERKLKHRIKKRGGSIQRWGNTLTIGVKDPSSVHVALLRVDEIDSLAQLAPARAVALLGDIAPTPKITEALAHAEADPRWRRILSDLLIERIVGIDADVARRLARAEASSNRRGR
jgi:hypothetical protein